MINRILERLEKEKGKVTNYEECSEHRRLAQQWNNCIDECKKIVQEVAKEYGNGWIPVEERLPSESERWIGHDITDAEPREFIVMVKGAYVPTTGYYTDNGWVKDIYNKEKNGYANEIIAWRFFPASYQKGEQKKAFNEEKCRTARHFAACADSYCSDDCDMQCPHEKGE